MNTLPKINAEWLWSMLNLQIQRFIFKMYVGVQIFHCHCMSHQSWHVHSRVCNKIFGGQSYMQSMYTNSPYYSCIYLTIIMCHFLEWLHGAPTWGRMLSTQSHVMGYGMCHCVGGVVRVLLSWQWYLTVIKLDYFSSCLHVYHVSATKKGGWSETGQLVIVINVLWLVFSMILTAVLLTLCFPLMNIKLKF